MDRRGRIMREAMSTLSATALTFGVLWLVANVI